MGSLPPEERPIIGQLANEIRNELEEGLRKRTAALKQAAMEKQLEAETIDVTIPGKRPVLGKLHPITKVLNELTEIFLGMGFDIAEGPEVEWDSYNFEALNIPKNHPARDVQDTFYINENMLLRTHTSPVQIRTMLGKSPHQDNMSCGFIVLMRWMPPLSHIPPDEGLVVDRILPWRFEGVLMCSQKVFGLVPEPSSVPTIFPLRNPVPK